MAVITTYDEGADGKEYVRWGAAFFKPEKGEPIKSKKAKNLRVPVNRLRKFLKPHRNGKKVKS